MKRLIDDFVVARLTLLAERRRWSKKKIFEKETIDRWFVVARLTLFTERRGSGGRKFFEKKSKIFLSIFHRLWRISHLLYRGDSFSEEWKNNLSIFTGSDGCDPHGYVWRRPHERRRVTVAIYTARLIRLPTLTCPFWPDMSSYGCLCTYIGFSFICLFIYLFIFFIYLYFFFFFFFFFFLFYSTLCFYLLFPLPYSHLAFAFAVSFLPF